MAGASGPQRLVERLSVVASGGLDVEAFWRAATEELERFVDFDWRPCWFTLDPGSLVMTSHFNEQIDHLDPAVFQNEYVDDDVNKMADLASTGVGIATLERATEGDRRRSARYRDLLSEYGLGHEVVAVLGSGNAWWAGVTLYREEGSSDFDDDDLHLLRAAAPVLAEGARRGLLVGEALEPAEGAAAAGVLLLDNELRVTSMSASASAWLTKLGGSAERLPAAVRSVGAATWRNEPSDDLPFARLRTRAGTWALVHGSRMAAGHDAVAVIVEPASPERLGPLLMSAYGLTDREQEVTALLLHGGSTKDIAQSLHMSVYTVQDHLKSVFDKTGARTRQQVLARVFFDHFEPRVRDNEDRVLQGKAIKGGAAPGARA